jgi:hypothetical protein
MQAMTSVLNRRWLSMGWRIQAPEDSDPMAIAFITTLDTMNVPYRHYDELYDRTIAVRAKRIAHGLSSEDFSADLMLSCWPQLAEDIHNREIDRKRLLPPDPEDICQLCFATGMADCNGRGFAPCPKCRPKVFEKIMERGGYRGKH